MQSMTIEESRSWCCQDATSLKLTSEDTLYYQNEEEPSFMVKAPLEDRRLAALTHDILMLSDPSMFDGGFVWLRQWKVGVSELARPGWRIIEAIRRAHGDPRSLDIAPGQLFRHDEFVELHAFLIQIMAYGWGAYFVPSFGDYLLHFRTSDKFFCKARSAEKLAELYSALKPWKPSKESHRAV